MNPWSLWIIAGISLFIAEMFVPGFVIASLGFGAIAAGIGAAFDLVFKWQLVCFCLGTIVSLFAFRPFFLKLEKGNAGIRTGVDALVGRDALVLQPIDNLQGAGRVRIGGEEWKALAEDGNKIAVGTVVSIVRIEGVKLIVTEKKKEDEV